MADSSMRVMVVRLVVQMRLRMCSINSGRSLLRSFKDGSFDAHDIEAVVKIFTKALLLHELLQVLVGGRNNTHVDLSRLPAAERVELAVFDDP